MPLPLPRKEWKAMTLANTRKFCEHRQQAFLGFTKLAEYGAFTL